MISRQAVLEVALCFAGRELTDGEENVLSILCGGALEQWLGYSGATKEKVKSSMY